MLDAQTVSLQLVTQLGRILDAIALRDADLARQLRRAATSIHLNIAEGRERFGRDRGQHFRIAAGSAAEVTAGLQVALALGHVAEVAEPLALLDRLRAMLWRLSR